MLDICTEVLRTLYQHNRPKLPPFLSIRRVTPVYLTVPNPDYIWDVYSCYCKVRLVTLPWWGLWGRKFLILITLDRWKRLSGKELHRKLLLHTKKYFSKFLKKYYLGGFFWAPIPHKRYQNTSGFANAWELQTIYLGTCKFENMYAITSK